ncbi:MAG: hypothetical protein K9N46_08565 [Candidatus Marinimicrobia bacterium]|nr:hypothetical protein [Candidatus Neomarinimicrobiota bacterium]MCF7828860.1 hypothetical protein [Candidatus Neomarinimicrobiota bacterium]MCF7880777.1 hypothetical protein [Candidatus Neomarinimicrobiota bacterium]
MRSQLLHSLIFLFLLGGIITVQLEAHPGFARKYRMSCTTCHDPAPRLKDFGEEFAGNGFVMEGKEPSRFHLDTGDPDLLLQALPPIGFRLDAYAHFEPGADNAHRINDLRTPYSLKFLSGGRITENISYYFYFFVSERGEVAGVEDAYLYFRDFLGTPIGLSIGQFQVSDPLFKRALRLEYEDYLIYRTQVGLVPTALTYDRGLMAGYTAPWGSDFIFELVNGNGIPEADGLHNFDNDNFKNMFLRWSHNFGMFRLGAFGYYGQTTMRGVLASEGPNVTNMVGPDATLELGKVQLNLQYLMRLDDNPMLNTTHLAEPVITQGGLAEAIYAPNGDRSNWYLIGLYNYRTSDLLDAPGVTNFIASNGLSQANYALDYHSVGVTWTYVLGTNIRLLTEYNFDIENEANRFTVGFFSGF